jgi:outer membrane lipoprotein-sorting protein
VRSIAHKLGIGEYRIIQNNANISYTDYIKEGRVLSVPNVYASKTLMYIDKELNLPVYIKAFDDQGFYESYEFYDLKINLNFNAKEFDKSFAGYGF